MKKAIAILFAAAVGIHCGVQPGEPGDLTQDDPVTAVRPPSATRPPPSDEEEQEAPPDRSAASRSTLNTAVVTDSGVDEDGSLYATGTYVGTIRFGSTVLTSRGEEDVFIMKTNANGSYAWARSAGSAEVERNPHVLEIKDGHVSITGLTKGELDCGGGPLTAWNKSTLFWCVFGVTDGTVLEGGTIPVQ